MSRFINDAMQLLKAAEQAAIAGTNPSDLTILISHEGCIQMISDCDWPLDSLRAHHGSRTVYRISSRLSNVRPEGREAGRFCVFETESGILAATKVNLVARPNACGISSMSFAEG